MGRTGQGTCRFYGLFDLVCNVDWLWLAYEYVAQNAGSKTAGCDGIDVMGFYENEVDNIKRLYGISPSRVLFEACPVREGVHPQVERQDASVGHPDGSCILHLFASDLREMTLGGLHHRPKRGKEACASSRTRFPTDSRCQDTAFSSLRRAVFPPVAEPPSDS